MFFNCYQLNKKLNILFSLNSEMGIYFFEIYIKNKLHTIKISISFNHLSPIDLLKDKNFVRNISSWYLLFCLIPDDCPFYSE